MRGSRTAASQRAPVWWRQHGCLKPTSSAGVLCSSVCADGYQHAWPASWCEALHMHTARMCVLHLYRTCREKVKGLLDAFLKEVGQLAEDFARDAPYASDSAMATTTAGALRFLEGSRAAVADVRKRVRHKARSQAPRHGHGWDVDGACGECGGAGQGILLFAQGIRGLLPPPPPHPPAPPPHPSTKPTLPEQAPLPAIASSPAHPHPPRTPT